MGKAFSTIESEKEKGFPFAVLSVKESFGWCWVRTGLSR